MDQAQHHQQQLEFQEYQQARNKLLAEMLSHIDIIKVYEGSQYLEGQIRRQRSIEELIRVRDEYQQLQDQFWGRK
jgi:hypothetical protein